MRSSLTSLAWPGHWLTEAVHALALQSGLSRSPLPTGAGGDMESIAQSLNLEAQAAETSYSDFERQLPTMGPGILQLPGLGEPTFLAILRGNRRRIYIIASDRKLHAVRPESIQAAVCRQLEAPLISQVEDMLGRAGVPKSKRARAREAILRERLGSQRVRDIWLLRPPPSADFWRQLRLARVPQRMLALGGLHALQYVLWILAWWVIGAGALQGRMEPAWLSAWALLLFTLVPCRVLITWLQGVIAIGAGGLLKQRLFYGSLRLKPDSIRHQGVGQLLGRVIESEAVEAMALSGGFLGLVATIELALAAVVLGRGAGGALHVFTLLAWVACTAIAGWRYFRHYQSWTDTRLSMTHDLVESMVGHRTRLAQQSPERWHQEEDEALEIYLNRGRALDRYSAILASVVPRGWMLLGLAALIPAFAYGDPTASRRAVAAGGILLAYRAFKRLSAGLSQVLAAAVAWRRVAPLFQAASLSDNPAPVACDQGGQPVIEARDLTFRYRPGAEPVLRNCNLRISANDRIVLEGPSGGGKSTLVSLLMGLRQAESGSLTIAGGAWRRVAVAPQFHDNHVLAETFAFNLLMGRDGSLSPADIAEASEICVELGLGDVLERMPAGMLQMVGETGWQLSHGERSRLYIARALLQNADLVVLDESFAALDPQNLKLVMQCVLKRAPTLLVVAHR